MNMYSIIQAKKEGKELTEEEIHFFVTGVTKENIPDYQTSALLMAICLKGMTERETALLTREMMDSGELVDLSCFGNKSVDKHSTGGVGDKTTLILAPIVGAAGGIVAKMSGRGLGFTGGTVDKMEAIPGMKTDLSPKEFIAVSEKVGVCVVGQNQSLAPADQKLYALRDVTATIDSIPLIASSIMSKKMAAGTKNIVLDVKFGNGAFMKTREDAKKLAETMVKIGTALGRRVRALVTDMDVPLGRMVGNALEVKEAIEVLSGKGEEDLVRTSLSLAGEMLSLVHDVSGEEGRKLAKESLYSGKALEKMKEWISAQGGDPLITEDISLLPQAKFTHRVLSPYAGYLAFLPAETVGFVSLELGAGRKTKGAAIDAAAGVELLKKVGDQVEQGEELAVFYASDPALFSSAEKRFVDSLVFSPRKIKKKTEEFLLVE